jgi:hypothetical protein
MSIRAGSITAFHLFDIADEIDLAAVPRLLQTEPARARLTPKPYTPAYLQYQTPPLVIDAAVLDLPDLPGWRLRIKVFDYGIVSLAFSTPFSGTWTEMAARGLALPELEPPALDRCRALAERLRPALAREHPPDLREDYVVFAVTLLDEPLTADDLVASHGESIAALLRGERETLSRQEREEVLHHRLSYFADDLVIPAWSAAFVRETEDGLPAIFRFTVEQTQMSRANLLELTIVLILVLELILVFLGVMT